MEASAHVCFGAKVPVLSALQPLVTASTSPGTFLVRPVVARSTEVDGFVSTTVSTGSGKGYLSALSGVSGQLWPNPSQERARCVPA